MLKVTFLSLAFLFLLSFSQAKVAEVEIEINQGLDSPESLVPMYFSF